MIQNSPHRFSFAIFIILAFGLTWLGWIPGLLIGAEKSYIMPNFDSYHLLAESGFANAQHLLLGLAFSLAVYGPLVAALVAVWLDSGKAGLADLWERITRWRIEKRWYLYALVIAILLPGVPVAIMAASGGLAESPFSALPAAFVLLIFIIQLFTSGLGEEPGWRGYLLPRLQARFPGEKSIWFLGLIWAAWHYPFVIFQTLSMMQDVTPAQIAVTIVSSLAGQTMSLIGLTFLYVWLYNQTGSIFLAVIFHALTNTLSFWFTSLLSQPGAVTILVALMPWAAVLILQRRLGKERFPGSIAAS